MASPIILRPLLPGEFSDVRSPESEYDDFGPAGHAAPPPCAVDADGTLAIEAVDHRRRADRHRGLALMQWGPNSSSAAR
ncbi:MAG: hypothetical protein IPI32_08815 [Austwickia sp.]|nr:hypothetical protein [Austwickia sp.]